MAISLFHLDKVHDGLLIGRQIAPDVRRAIFAQEGPSTENDGLSAFRGCDSVLSDLNFYFRAIEVRTRQFARNVDRDAHIEKCLCWANGLRNVKPPVAYHGIFVNLRRDVLLEGKPKRCRRVVFFLIAMAGSSEGLESAFAVSALQ